MHTSNRWAADLAEWAAHAKYEKHNPVPGWPSGAHPAPRVVATDASILPGSPGAGIAVSSSEGIIWQEHLLHTRDTTIAELTALCRALEHTPGSQPLLVLSDSQAAIRYATSATPKRSDIASLATAIKRLAAKRTVEFRWVKAHTGHELNEAADLAAKEARMTPLRFSPAQVRPTLLPATASRTRPSAVPP